MFVCLRGFDLQGKCTHTYIHTYVHTYIHQVILENRCIFVSKEPDGKEVYKLSKDGGTIVADIVYPCMGGKPDTTLRMLFMYVCVHVCVCMLCVCMCACVYMYGGQDRYYLTYAIFYVCMCVVCMYVFIRFVV